MSSYRLSLSIPAILNKQLQTRLESIKTKLTVNPKETQAAKRKKISATDKRPTARAVGASLGIGILAVLFCVIVLPDIPIIMRHIIHGAELTY